MHRDRVASSNIATIGYDARTETLEIEFYHGGTYQYYGVSSAIYRQIVAAPSVGRFFHTYIRNRYPYSRVS